MFPNNYILFLQIILFLFITPGAPKIVIVTQAINYGVKKCMWTALGDISANTLQMILVVFVIGGFLSNNPQILNVLKWLGVIYLFYLAYDIYTSRILNINKKKNYSKSIFSFYKDGFLVAGTGAKAWMFFPLIFPQFIDFNSNYYVQFLILMFTYISLDFVSLMAYAMAAEKMIKWLKANPRTINKISACVLIILALIIAITQNY